MGIKMKSGYKKSGQISLLEKLMTITFFAILFFDFFFIIFYSLGKRSGENMMWFFLIIQVLILFVLFIYFKSCLGGYDVLLSKLKRMAEGDAGLSFYQENLGSDVKLMATMLDNVFSRNYDNLKKVEELSYVMEINLVSLKDNLMHQEKNTIIATGAVDKASEVMKYVKKVVDKISSEIQSMLISVGNTVYSVQVMENSIEKVDNDAQNMGSFVEKTSMSIENMAQSIEEVAVNVENTSSLAKSAAESAVEGGKVVHELIDAITQISGNMDEFSFTMGELGKRSKEIGKITATIDDIAAQTNLLALNAAIEASRAGEQGKGFAIVASEIKKLAQKTSNATKEITRMIKSMQQDTGKVIKTVARGNEQVRSGVVMADKAGDSLNIIVETIGQVSRLVSEINQRTTDQGRASQQIIKSTALMNELTGAVTLSTKQQYENSQLITEVVLDMQKVTNKVVEMLETQHSAIERVNLSVNEVREATCLIIESMRSMERLSVSLKDSSLIMDNFVLKGYRL